jgi:hypothetical protein
LKTIKGLIRLFKKSNKYRHELKTEAGKLLIQDVKTRWNSTFLMLDRMIELRFSVLQILEKVRQRLPSVITHRA